MRVTGLRLSKARVTSEGWVKYGGMVLIFPVPKRHRAQRIANNALIQSLNVLGRSSPSRGRCRSHQNPWF